MAGNLIIPRVSVLWGGEDITLYQPSTAWAADGVDPQPLVYDVSVSLQEEGQTPQGRMKWNPCAQAYDEYENKFLKDKINAPIQITFYYINGRSITFQFIWAGHQITYGTSMQLEVTLATELDGLINGNQRSTAQASEAPITYKQGIGKAAEQFNVANDIILYTEQASKDTDKATFQNTYGEDITFFEKVQQLGQANGNMVMASNIDSPGNVVIFTPYTWEKSPPVATPFDLQSTWPPNKRYGYFLGPSVIKTMVRTAEWQKPQKSQNTNTTSPAKVQPATTTQAQAQTPPSTPQVKQQDPGSKPTTAPQGAQGGKSTPNTANAKNEDGPTKQDIMKKERGSKIALNTFLVPSLVGIKPADILFVPSFKGDYLEDWIVTAVEYQQTDGGVDISIQGGRQYGLRNLMNKSLSESWLQQAIDKKLAGPGASLEAWEEYAWPTTLRGSPTI